MRLLFREGTHLTLPWEAWSLLAVARHFMTRWSMPAPEPVPVEHSRQRDPGQVRRSTA